ncbi:MAG: endolytic transglycosylase MltG [Candidatus Mariimomonas ferrooxydans]
MKKRFKSSTELAFILSGLILLSGLLVYLHLLKPISTEYKWKEIRIPRGVTYSQGIDILKKEDIIKNDFIFLVLGRLTMTDTRLRAGYYNLNTSMTPWEVFNSIRKGTIVQRAIILPEGSDLKDIKLKFLEAGLMDEDSWQLVRDKDFLDSLDIDSPSLEGYLYPDTYNFAKGTNPDDIFRIMVHRLRQHFNQNLTEKMEELGMNEREVLTLASIIEKEALYDRERPIISAVYHNRLNKNMRLQADPTVVYGIKKMQDGITRRDLKRATPYNTYVIYGLPPGPIASPGIESIKAALHPADVDYIYFVSKNDGTHYFSTTGDEHLNAVMLYQRNNRNTKTQSEPNPGNGPVTESGHTDQTTIHTGSQGTDTNSEINVAGEKEKNN